MTTTAEPPRHPPVDDREAAIPAPILALARSMAMARDGLPGGALYPNSHDTTGFTPPEMVADAGYAAVLPEAITAFAVLRPDLLRALLPPEVARAALSLAQDGGGAGEIVGAWLRARVGHGWE